MTSVDLVRAEGSSIAVIRTATTWEAFPALWPSLLDEVWAALRASGATTGHNVMVYEGDPPTVEVGVQVASPIEALGRVVPSSLPAGLTARAVHDGPPQTLAETHAAVAAWCRAHGHETTGVRWEIYGDPGPDGTFATEVHWQVRDLG